ncbi:hypothetical protein QBC44DRAFT_321004 [Cladorrhinum sp. PSN332]|nr:hypothetical protein QBC44DRAFT_321004 [Cladorrhinum sp. PSN332]
MPCYMIHTYVSIIVGSSIYLCVCVCVCVRIRRKLRDLTYPPIAKYYQSRKNRNVALRFLLGVFFSPLQPSFLPSFLPPSRPLPGPRPVLFPPRSFRFYRPNLETLFRYPPITHQVLQQRNQPNSQPTNRHRPLLKTRTKSGRRLQPTTILNVTLSGMTFSPVWF